MNKQVSCQDDLDAASLPLAEAQRRIRQILTPLTGTETVPLPASAGRVLAADARAAVTSPPTDNSAMDGYALRGTDLPASGTLDMKRLGTAYAGHPYSGAVGAGECVRIMTGASIPAGGDTVVIQERAEVQDDGTVRVGPGTKTGENVRSAGEDFHQGDVLLPRGRRLDAPAIGLLAAGGVAAVSVYQPLRVAFLSTGDELLSVGEPQADGRIYDSNRHTLRALLTRPGIVPLDYGLVRDKEEDLHRVLSKAGAEADALITSGGVSVGEADLVRQVLESIGDISLWKVAMKPGRPFAFGRVGSAWFFGMPGNPVSVMVTWDQIVWPALRYLSGETVSAPSLFQVPCQSALRKRPGRVEYQRGILFRDDNGELAVKKTGDQGSGIINSMVNANCYIVLPLDCDGVQSGATVTVQPFSANG